MPAPSRAHEPDSGAQVMSRTYTRAKNFCDPCHIGFLRKLPPCPRQLTSSPPLARFYATGEIADRVLCWLSGRRAPVKVVDSDAPTEVLRDIRPRHHIASKPSTVALHILRSTPGAAHEGKEVNRMVNLPRKKRKDRDYVAIVTAIASVALVLIELFR